MAKPDCDSSRHVHRSGGNRTKISEEWKQYIGDESLLNWQRLLHDLGKGGEFRSKNQCKKALQHVWVNIPDFLALIRQRNAVAMKLEDDAARNEALQQPVNVRFFETQKLLATYTKKTRKFFPRKDICKGSPLKLLLAEIVHPRG